jgi:hypothetical protein
MDRDIILKHLAVAQRKIADGEVALRRQRALVRQRAQDGQDTRRARKLLEEFEQLQAQLLKARDRLRAELRRSKSTPSC